MSYFILKSCILNLVISLLSSKTSHVYQEVFMLGIKYFHYLHCSKNFYRGVAHELVGFMSDMEYVCDNN